jgi:hypothetical protein
MVSRPVSISYVTKELEVKIILVPDVITPAQYFDSKRPNREDDPLNRLMMAVLQDAIRCFQRAASGRSTVKKQNFREVKEWFFGRPGEGPFSFVSVCEVLEITPEYLRTGLVAWQHQCNAGLAQPLLSRRSPVLGLGQISSSPKRIVRVKK